jgi:hypothetical protein
MKTNTAIIFVLFLAFVAIANAQNSTNTTTETGNAVTQCIKANNCGTDLKCISKCAGVPDPSPQDANNTNACVAKCNQSDPTSVYEACVSSCVTTIFQPTGDTSSPSSSGTPSASGSSSGASKSTSGSEGTSSPSGNSTAKSAAQSLDVKHAFLNSFSMATLLLVCVVASLVGVGF